VVDGGSSDGTPDQARQAGAEIIAVGRGYGLACLTGAEAAGAGDIVVFMDGDGADDPAAVAALIAPIRAGAYDFVIASRARGKREPGSMAWHQLLAGRIAGAVGTPRSPARCVARSGPASKSSRPSRASPWSRRPGAPRVRAVCFLVHAVFRHGRTCSG
jgi:glycosyltransferase involved in cell wall biosynthesis